jgi:hypothetical protein
VSFLIPLLTIMSNFSFSLNPDRRVDQVWHGTTPLALLVAIGAMFYLVLGSALPAAARSMRLSLEFPIYAQSSFQPTWTQMESSVAQRLEQSFAQAADLDAINLLVTVNRNGNILPYFSINVSRQQWQSRPDVKAWIKYHRTFAEASTQFERLDMRSNVAARPVNSQANSQAAIDRAFDQNQLSPQEAQRYLSDRD